MGQIHAAQLEYSEAQNYLQQALRKAPQHSAVGFKQIVQKLCITAELLMGDIPDRHLFRQLSMRKNLAPYFQLTQTVRTGNLAKFNGILSMFGAISRGEAGERTSGATISLTSDLFREDTFTWVGTASVESSDLAIKEISFTRITTLWCINQCKKFPGCHGIEFCNSGKSLCRLWNGPFDQQMAANGTHLAECNRFSKDTVLTSGMMTESVIMISTDLMPTIDTITGAIVTTPGSISPLIDTITPLLTTSNEDTATSGESITTKDNTIQIDFTTSDTNPSVYSTKDDNTISVGSTTVVTSLVDSTTTNAITTINSNIDDSTTKITLTTFDCPDCECWMTQGLSGALPIYLNGQLKEVNCENSSTYSWTVFQRRFDGSESFDRTWLEYEDGFGSAAGEFWLVWIRYCPFHAKEAVTN
uniref:26S proteasome non-ATPase regulatory subunit 3 n=1 Tax=Magallana gigas TaxID=29159 RepID=K1QIV9_MAGGI